MEALLDEATSLGYDSDARWEAVRELHRRGTREVFDKAVELLSGSTSQQVAGLDVLAQLGCMMRNSDDRLPFRQDTIPHLLEALDSAHDEVKSSALVALGHQKLVEAIPAVVRLADDPSEDVRFSLAYALGGLDDDLAIATLIRLSEDGDEDVRDWATFGLGSLCERDDLVIREALYRRLDDKHEDTRAEALMGLATRGDQRSKPLLKQRLVGDSITRLEVEAAGAYADPEFLQDLREWRERQSGNADAWFVRALDEAIEACSGKGPRS
jgi:hypothetical protein